jgi:hypothetical protein
MKKKILGGIALLAIAVMAAWNVNLNSQSNELSTLSLKNLEVLAQEVTTDTGCPTGCVGGGDYCYCYQIYWDEQPPKSSN